MLYLGDITFLLLIPALILAFYAQAKVQGNYARYAKVRGLVGMTGAEVARIILDRNGLQDVKIVPIEGKLTDNYDPRSRELHLSKEVYAGNSVSAMSIAAHECGHAIQHALGYKPIVLRARILPLANLGCNLAFPLFIAGLIFSLKGLMDIGILLFLAALLFQMVTLPVEYNASQRALEQLSDRIIIADEEMMGAKKVLNAAALTYVAATLMALLNLLRLLLLRNARN
ncbi:MAG TPA: zinc metallopeptidase [Candidatus Cloacimonadota bacterium]|nr:zinc metallopeptidase [Candidatus Cloacimonadota bacterium]